jgi:prevent-host-death family protein
MRVVNIHDAKTNLSRLVEEAVRGEPFVIARAGKPLVKVMPLGAPDTQDQQRTGFLSGRVCVPDDFNTLGQAQIETLFGLA